MEPSNEKPYIPPQPMNEEEKAKQDMLDKISGKLISGDYRSVALSMMDEDGQLINFYDGFAVVALGLADSLRADILRIMSLPSDE